MRFDRTTPSLTGTGSVDTVRGAGGLGGGAGSAGGGGGGAARSGIPKSEEKGAGPPFPPAPLPLLGRNPGVDAGDSSATLTISVGIAMGANSA